MLTAVQEVLRSESLEGTLSEMLCAGLPHAVEGVPEDRHNMQIHMLKMAAQTLGTARDKAQAAEAACKQKVEAVQVEVDARKAASAAAREALSAAQSATAAQKDALGECKRTVAREEHEHKRVEAIDKSGKKIMAGLEKNRKEVAALLASTDEKGDAEDIETFLHDEKAESVLIAALPSVLAKEPSERIGFDLVALASVKEFIGNKVADLDAEIAAEAARQADAHAEAVGAFAVMDLAKERLQDAVARLKEAEAAVEECREKLKETNAAMQQEERSLAEGLVEVSMAEAQTRQCCEAVDFLKGLEAGPKADTASADTVAPDVEMAVAAVA